MTKIFLFQAIQFSQTVLFQVIQFRIRMNFSSIWLIDRTPSGATISGQSGPGSNGNERVLRIPQSTCITGTSPSDCLVSYPGHSFGWVGRLLPLCRCAVGVFYSPSQLGNCWKESSDVRSSNPLGGVSLCTNAPGKCINPFALIHQL